MKRIILMMIVLVTSLISNAQVLDLDEVTLLGKWEVYDKDGRFESEFPEAIIFNEPYLIVDEFPSDEGTIVRNVLTNLSQIVIDTGGYGLGGFFNPTYNLYKDYVVGGTLNGQYTLHMFPYHEEDIKVICFVVKKFCNDELVLSTYSGDGALYLRKAQNSIMSPQQDVNCKDNKMYNIQGMEVKDPHGIYIQNGEKRVSK